jgi:peptidoglycan-associated lipoprotein
MNVVSIVRGAKFAAILLGAIAIAGCAKQPDQTAMANAAAPGSQQDFIVNVGDRVFFETDSSELTPQARATLDKQAQWLSQYNRYSFIIEGHADERGTREYNIALGARAVRANGARILDLARRDGAAHAHHLVWQGTAGRGV